MQCLQKLGWLAVACLFGGCTPQSRSKPDIPSLLQGDRNIIAQGQIMPAAGFIHLPTPPGDVVAEMLVEPGESVSPGQTLAVMRSQAVRAAQRATLSQQRDAAIQEQQDAITQAEYRLQAAELKMSQLADQRRGLTGKADLLAMAKLQTDTSRQILTKLQRISNDQLTGEFVGNLEVERQRLAVSQAELDYQRQQQELEQATQDLDYAQRAADGEVRALLGHLESLRQSEAIETLDLQLVALDVQDQAAAIVAPSAGVILAVNARPGEASLHQPLIEMADTSQLVCEVEVNEMDAGLVEPGQAAVVRSRAFQQPLRGSVGKKFQLVGRPQLRPLDPLARVDYRTITAIIRLDPESVARAKDWLQLQVEVEISVSDSAAQPLP